jgi:hypothetical protein
VRTIRFRETATGNAVSVLAPLLGELSLELPFNIFDG